MTDREKELEAQVEALQQQMVAMDRILSGRTAVSNSLAAESGLLLAPFLHVQGLFDHGEPPFQPTGIQFRLDTTFRADNGAMWTGSHDTGQRYGIQSLTQRSRLIIAIVNPQK